MCGLDDTYKTQICVGQSLGAGWIIYNVTHPWLLFHTLYREWDGGCIWTPPEYDAGPSLSIPSPRICQKLFDNSLLPLNLQGWRAVLWDWSILSAMTRPEFVLSMLITTLLFFQFWSANVENNDEPEIWVVEVNSCTWKLLMNVFCKLL